MNEAKIIKKVPMEIEKTPAVVETRFDLVQVPTQHTLAVQTPNGEIISTEEAIVEILNKVSRLENNLIGSSAR